MRNLAVYSRKNIKSGKQGHDAKSLKGIMARLQRQEKLESKYHDHDLIGNCDAYSDFSLSVARSFAAFSCFGLRCRRSLQTCMASTVLSAFAWASAR